jgi:Fe-S cluster biogenesis protein NfuA
VLHDQHGRFVGLQKPGSKVSLLDFPYQCEGCKISTETTTSALKKCERARFEGRGRGREYLFRKAGVNDVDNVVNGE